MKSHNKHKASDIVFRRNNHRRAFLPDERCMLYYLGKSHQQYDLWETNLDAFCNLHWEFVRLCYPSVVKIQTGIMQRCRFVVLCRRIILTLGNPSS
jgi:hypothetical protein